jgi:AmmeMemoRadiSam system protein A
MSAAEPVREPARLDESDQKELLRIARATLREFLSTGYMPPGAPHRKSLLVPAGAFVSVYVDDELRGCMGRVDADTPLYLAVEQLAVAAATRDPRFDPVRIEELKLTRLEISVLSSVAPIDPAHIEIGKHGLVVTRGPRRGLLLPQVAVKHGFERDQFLDETCAKAGLAAGAWREAGTHIEAFTADVFSESQNGGDPLPPRRVS